MPRHHAPARPDGLPLDHYTFVATSKVRSCLVGLLLLLLGTLAYAVYLLVTVGGTTSMIVAAGAAIAVVMIWGTLQARIPQRIEIERAVITIIRNGERQRYDLEDPGVELRVRDGEIAFAHYMKPWTVVSARDVDWHTFTNVVMHYQNNADLNAELRDQRFSR